MQIPERGNRLRTFFEARMSAESDLVPHIAHCIRAADFCPVVEKVLHLNLPIVVNFCALIPTCIAIIHLSNNFKGGRER